MEIVLKAAYFDSGQVFGIAARLEDGTPEQKGHAVAFPTGSTPKEVAAKLRELAKWIEQEARNEHAVPAKRA